MLFLRFLGYININNIKPHLTILHICGRGVGRP